MESLPPNKRYKLAQIHKHQKPTLPAKKRKPSSPEKPPSPPSSYSLPAKKRVWALPPLFDLNTIYEDSDEADISLAKPPIIDDDVAKPPIEDIPAEKRPTIDDDVEKSPIDEKDVANPQTSDEDDDGIVCAICQSTDGDPTDPIVLCDGCDVMVHVTCYGSPLIHEIPSGDWFCARCSNGDSPSCSLCPNHGGALKPTAEPGKWAHVVCALLVPEVYFEDSEAREGINLTRVPQARWERQCYVCGGDGGCVVECSELKCGLAFHVTCGIDQDFCFEYMKGKRTSDVVAGFCKAHSDLWKKV